MIKLLSKAGKVKDIAREHFGESPITYGECKEEDLSVSAEIALTHVDD